ncbi:MAG: DNA primase [Elusimicrobiota bacterium]
MYSRDQIDKVRSTVDIVEVIRPYVPSLKASGRSVKGLCPFHGEKTPSFHVHPEKGLFKCFGCGESGDAIGFLVKLEQVSFTDALEKLATDVGIVLQKENSQQVKSEEGIREKIFRVLEAARIFYEDQLWDPQVGGEAKKYLESRGITENTIREFNLGYAPSGSSSAFESLIKKGFSIELCQKAGLLVRSQAGRFYDPMFGRVIFPIFDSFGHTIGFGGRILPESKKKLPGFDAPSEEGESGPKYLNSPETPVFSKGKSLYGLKQSKGAILTARKAILLEGYMDVVGVYQGGVQNVVATLGTALTKDHAKLLKRYVNETISFFDPDQAGKTAAIRGIPPLLEEEIFPKIVRTFEVNDPDEIILEKGVEYFQNLVDQSPDFVDYLIQNLDGSSALSLQQKAEFGKQVIELVSHSKNEILKNEWISRVSRFMGVNESSLKSEMGRQKGFSSTSPKVIEKKYVNKKFLPTAEEELLQLLMSGVEMWINLEVAAEDFQGARTKALFELLLKQMNENGRINVPGLYDGISEEEKNWLLELTLEEKYFDEPLERRNQLVKSILMARDRKRLGELSQLLAHGKMLDADRQLYSDLLKRTKGSTPRE